MLVHQVLATSYFQQTNVTHGIIDGIFGKNARRRRNFCLLHSKVPIDSTC